jgi:hypothetical protein
MSNITKHEIETRGWRRLPPADLENLITKIRRSAVHQHLSLRAWRELDRMRAYHAALLKEGTPN